MKHTEAKGFVKQKTQQLYLQQSARVFPPMFSSNTQLLNHIGGVKYFTQNYTNY